MIDVVISSFSKVFPEINMVLATGLPIFARVLGLIRFTPFLQRTEIPALAKISFAMFFSVLLVMYIKPTPEPQNMSIIFTMAINFAFGAIIGFIVNCIISAIEAGGDMMNMQMGVSSATILDPTTSTQTSIVGRTFGMLGILIFLHIGGAYWTFNAFIKSFEIFPVYATSIPLENVINMTYLTKITSNVLFIGLQIASPVLIATLGQDIILGIISKTAPQINVFQLSFLFKPVFGATILIWILPILYNVITDYFLSFAQIF